MKKLESVEKQTIEVSRHHRKMEKEKGFTPTPPLLIPEIAKLSRQHNNSNVLCMPARFITNDEALAMLDIWLETEFEGGRHQRRLDKMPIAK